jgi:AmmeMemoRadiSam system protein B
MAHSTPTVKPSLADFLTLSVAMSSVPPNKTVRAPKFAGDLYPADEAVLRAQVDAALASAKTTHTPVTGKIKTLIVPHDHYQHALPTMAAAYSQLGDVKYDVILFIAPTVDSFPKLALSGYGFFETPLGDVELNDYVRNEFCDEDDDFFITEEGLPKGSSIEVQLPIIQRSIGKETPIRIVPMLVGSQTIDLCNEAAAAASEIMQLKNALIVAVNNFHAPAKNKTLIAEYMDALREQDYSALLRLNVVHGSSLGSGLGTVAIAARVAHALGAKKFHTIAESENTVMDKHYLSGCFTKD